MRVSLPTIALSFVAAFAWLSWSAAAADAEAPGVSMITDHGIPPSQGQVPGQLQGPSQGQLASPGQFSSQGQFVDQGQYAGPVSDCAPASGPCSPCWTFTAEALALQRTNTRSQPLFVPFIPTLALHDPLDAENMNFALGFGPKVSAIRHDVCGCDLEVTYFQVDGFTAGGELPGISRMVTDMTNTGLLVNDGMNRYTSALYNGELNLRRQANDWLTLLAGFRMVELDEHYRGGGVDVFTPTQVDSLFTNSFNHLFGGQIGAEAQVFNRGGPLQVNALCKVGVFGNAAQQNYQLFGDTAELLTAKSCSQTSCLGETGLVATYALSKHLAFRGSLDAMWLSGVALAPEQIGSVNVRRHTDVVNTSGNVFYYGGGAGLECRF